MAKKGRAKRHISFRHPLNGYVEPVPQLAWLKTLLFGSVYLAYRGLWWHAGMNFTIDTAIAGAAARGGALWSMAFLLVANGIYAWFVDRMISTSYLRQGWTPVRPRRRDPMDETDDSAEPI